MKSEQKIRRGKQSNYIYKGGLRDQIVITAVVSCWHTSVFAQNYSLDKKVG